MITEDYVSFETAKLLKEKGFEPPHDYRKWLPNLYTDNGEIKWGIWSDDWYPRITLQMAMKWLREIHNITIGITFSYGLISYEIQKNGEFITSIGSSRTYEQMVDEAIQLCVKTLI